jgi:hypothetical protein
MSDDDGYYCSIKPMEQKKWIVIKSPWFSNLEMVTQYVGVILSAVNLHYLQRIEISKISLTIAIRKFFRL